MSAILSAAKLFGLSFSATFLIGANAAIFWESSRLFVDPTVHGAVSETTSQSLRLAVAFPGRGALAIGQGTAAVGRGVVSVGASVQNMVAAFGSEASSAIASVWSTPTWSGPATRTRLQQTASKYTKPVQKASEKTRQLAEHVQAVPQILGETTEDAITALKKRVSSLEASITGTATTPTAVATTGINLLINSSFEANGEAEPNHWDYTAGSSTGNSKVTPEAIRTGTNGFKFIGGDPSSFGLIQPETKALKDRTYTLSLYLKYTNVPAGATLRLGFWDQDGNKRATLENTDILSTKDWHRILMTTTTTGKDWFPLIEVVGLTSGAVYIDDVQLEEGSLVSVYHRSAGTGEGSILTDPSGNIKPAKDGQGTLGTTGNQWKALYLLEAEIDQNGNLVVNGATVNSDLTVNQNVTLGDSTSDSINIKGVLNTNLIPKSDGTFDIGASGNRWSSIYVNTLDTNGNVTLGDQTTDTLLVAGTLTVNGAGTFNSTTALSINSAINVKGSGDSYVAGEFGAGTSAPSANLHVVGSGLITQRVKIGDAIAATVPLDVQGAANVSGSLNVRDASAFSSRLKVGDLIAATVPFDVEGAGNFSGALNVTGIVTTSNALRVNAGDADSYVAAEFGIGTSAPSANLHVVGSGLITTRLKLGDARAAVVPFDVQGAGNVSGSLNVLERLNVGAINPATLEFEVEGAGNFSGALNVTGIVTTSNALRVNAGDADSYVAAEFGVGTSAPSANIHVVGSGLITQRVKIGDAIAATVPFDVQGAANVSGALNVSGTALLSGAVNVTGGPVISGNGQFYSDVGTSAGSVGYIFDTYSNINTAGTYLVSFRRQGTPIVSINGADGSLNVSGRISAASATIGTPGQPGDVAEIVPTNDPAVGPGDVVVMDTAYAGASYGMKRATQPYERNLLGVVSTTPTVNMGGFEGGQPVALIGVVPVKVTGEIVPGDYLTSSSIPGLAMKATRAGLVIGQALTGGSGTVKAFVQVMWYDPASELVRDDEAVLAALGGEVPDGGDAVLGASVEGSTLTSPTADSQQTTINTEDGDVLGTTDDGALAVTVLEEVGSLMVRGTATVQGALEVLADAVIDGTLVVRQAATFLANLAVEGSLTVGGDLTLEGALTQTFTAGEALTAGEVVRVSGENEVRRASATSGPGIGLAVSTVSSGERLQVAIVGTVDGLSGLPTGATMFVSTTPGQLSASMPIEGNIQAIGVVRSPTSLLLLPGLGTTITIAPTPGVPASEPEAAPEPSPTPSPAPVSTPEPSPSPEGENEGETLGVTSDSPETGGQPTTVVPAETPAATPSAVTE